MDMLYFGQRYVNIWCDTIDIISKVWLLGWCSSFMIDSSESSSRDRHEQEWRRCIVFYVNTVNPGLAVDDD